MRVLLIAEACNPTWTSVPLVGYNFARALAERPELDITLVSQVRNRKALEADPIASLVRLQFIDNEWVARPLYKLASFLRGGLRESFRRLVRESFQRGSSRSGSQPAPGLSWTIDTAMGWPSYMVFEQQLWQSFQRGAFDLIHRITPLTPTMGSPLASRADAPMLIGPLNGGLPWPKEYPELRRQEREWLVPLRNLYKRLPYSQSTYRHLAGVIAGSRHTATEVPASFRGQRFYLPENGVDPARFALATAWPASQGRFRFITVGRLVPYKGVDLTLEAMARSPALKNCELHIVGDGPHRAYLEAMTRQYGLEGSVRFTGNLSQPQVREEFGRAQAFVFPSLREFGGGVVLEAMAAGLPVIVVDYGGPGELATPECGILLPMKPRAELVPRLQVAMEALAGDAARCRSLGEAACQRIRDEFTWSTKASRIVEIYRQLLSGTNISASVRVSS